MAVLAVAWLTPVGTAKAATLRVLSVPGSLQVGQTSDVQLVLDLEPNEQASVFEGHFTLGGASAAAVQIVPGGTGWVSSHGYVRTGTVDVSLTSANAGGSRVVATLKLTGRLPGTLSIAVDPTKSFASYDTSSAPFLQDLSLSSSGGTLASINVTGSGAVAVPGMSGATALLLAALLLLLTATLGRKAVRAHRAA